MKRRFLFIFIIALAMAGLAIVSAQDDADNMPALQSEFLFTLRADLAPPQDIGEVPGGFRSIVAATGGSVEGPAVNGEVLPGGGDWGLVRSDGVFVLDVRGTIRTDDGHLIYIHYPGYLAPLTPDAWDNLNRGEYDASEWYFRITPRFETSAEEYAWLNRVLAVGVGTVPELGQVEYQIYEIK